MTTSTGAVVDDPTPADLAGLVAEVRGGGDGAFLVLERHADPTGQTYLQALHQGGEWLVEVRAGSPDRHYRTVVLDAATVTSSFVSWSAGTPDWQALPWRHVARQSWWRRHRSTISLAGAVGS